MQLVAQPRYRAVSARALELLLEVHERCGHDITVVDIGTDSLHRIQPEAVDAFDVVGGQFRGVR
ncbi:MAG: hypothetical protein ABUS56_00710, partial [Acidobacteriota bacterium]